MEQKLKQILSSYTSNKANKELLQKFISSNNFRVIFEFNAKEISLHFNTIKQIFNINKFYNFNELKQIEASEVDAVFIMIPYDRKERIELTLWAIKNNKPLFILEAGFISSVRTLQEYESPISYHVDYNNNIYLFGSENNTITNLLNSDFSLSKKQKEDIQKLIELVISEDISKYNNFTATPNTKIEKNSILVIDQTLNDYSIYAANANKSTFDYMVKTAIYENPNSTIYIKIHPEVLIGKRKGNINIQEYNGRKNVKILTENLSPNYLFKDMSKVYTVSSTLGFEALLRNKEVHTFGQNFYSGWGCTIDHNHPQNRCKDRSIIEIAYAIYMHSTYYLNIESNKNSSPLEAIESFSKLVKEHNAQSNYYKYNTRVLENRISVIEKEFDIYVQNFSKKIANLELNLRKLNIELINSDPITKENSNTVDPAFATNKIQIKNQKQADIKPETSEIEKGKTFSENFIEKIISRIFLKDKLKNKYLKNQFDFYNDSKNVFIKLYWKYYKSTKIKR